MTEKLTVSVDEMAAMLGISRPVAYELTRREGFPASVCLNAASSYPWKPLKSG